MLQDSSGSTLPYLKPICIAIEAIESIADLFKFLLEHNYISYLNYEVLCDYADMFPDDEGQKIHREIQQVH